MEGEKHLQAKEKLFQLLMERRVKIKDQHSADYPIFNGKCVDEFLHIESFVMDYNGLSLFSNSNSPCKKYIVDVPLCDQSGYYGAFRELPCHQCIMNNIDVSLLKGDSEYASYRADISYGYGNKHRVWLEIKDTHGCSEHKIHFCKLHSIDLIEIDAEQIIELDGYNHVLVGQKLEPLYKVDVKISKSESFSKVSSLLDKDGYIISKDLRDIIYLGSYSMTEYHSNVQAIIEDLNLIELKNYNKHLQNHFNLDRMYKLYINSDKYDLIYKEIENDYEYSIKNKYINHISELKKHINKVGWMKLKDYRCKAEEGLPRGYKKLANDCNEYLGEGYVIVLMRDVHDKFMELNIQMEQSKYSHNGKVILSDKLYSKIN